ncbi:MAG: SurA N-terminal domain-containing protein [Elusimicrobiaceae bacterium]|nr:SurA N-terminal domain-containing protein [Elusimicrobiaceae bacterium]
MISFLIRHKKSILIITLAFFLGSIVYIGLDAYSRSNYSLTAATVGGQKISYRDLYRLSDQQANRLRSQGVDVNEDMLKFLQQQVLSSMVSEEVLNQAAQKAGLWVADYEVAYDIKTSPWFSQDGKFDKAAYEYALKSSVGVTPAQFEEQLRRDKLANRFRQTLYSFYKLTPEEVKYSYQVQHGNLKDFEANKQDFKLALMDTKMETAQKAFLDDFNNRVEIKTFLE